MTTPTRRTIMLGGGVLGLSALASACADSRARRAVVASFSILGDLVAHLLDDLAPLKVLVGPDADSHVYEPTPQDAAAVADALLVVENGLGFEPWLTRLRQSSGRARPACIAAEHVEPLQSGGALDPHAWHDVANTRLYVTAIADALKGTFPDHQATIADRAAQFASRLAALDHDVRARFSALSPEQRVVVTSHDAFGYFSRAYGVRFLAPLGFTTDSEARPDRVAALVEQIRRENVRALFMENMADPRLLRAIAAETGVRIGGRLYSDALSPADGPAASYEALMRHNVDTIMAALASP